MPRGRFFSLFRFAVVAVAGSALGAQACGEAYEGVDPGGAADAGPDTVAQADGGVDAFTPDGSPIEGGTASRCPPHAFTASCAGDPTTCTSKVLYAPTAPGNHVPFGMGTTRTSVYWLEQSSTDAGVDVYNGQTDARVLVVDKAGGPAREIARGQARATVLAVDDAYVYWRTRPTDTTSRVWRLPVDARPCSAICQPPEEFGQELGSEIRAMKIAGGTLFAQTLSSRLYYAATAGAGPFFLQEATVPGGLYPTLAATDDAVYVTTTQATTIAKVTPQGIASTFATIDVDGGPVGLNQIVSDCSAVYAFFPNNDVYRFAFAQPNAPSLVGSVPPGLIYETTADARFLWVAVANMGGIFAVDPVSKTEWKVRAGNRWHIASDADGIYFSDHDATGGGAVYMIDRR